MTALSFGGAPGVAVLGGDLDQLRRRGSRWRLRDWRLRTKLTAVLLVPLLLAGVLGALRVADSLRKADQFDVVARQVTFAQQVGVAVHDLQRERQLLATGVLDPDPAARSALPAQSSRVDFGVSALRAANAEAEVLDPDAAADYRAALDRLSRIDGLRQRALGAAPAPSAGDPNNPAVATVDDVLTGYTDMISALLNLNREVLGEADDSLAGSVQAVVALATAKEQVAQQHAVLGAAMLSGGLSAEQQVALRTAEARFDAAIDEFNEAASAEQRQRYADTVTADAVAERKRLLDDALATALQETPPDSPDDPAQDDPALNDSTAAWDSAATETADRIRQVEVALLSDLRSGTESLGATAWTNAIRDASVVGALMALAVLLLVLVVRSLLGPLRTLRTHAFDVADRRLPEVVEKLQSTEGQIDEITVDPVPVYSREEVGQVARAFDTVHLQAVRLAAEQAMLRGTVSDIFLNLAGRSQRLVERQLKLIDKLESGEQDPEQLSNLFQLDHLATRMRRNSENLLVLAGGELRRGTERGVPVLDMLRAAISEVAEYRRVTLRRPPTATVAGPVAGDLVHLIAELLDNATNAGPPDTSVTLSSALTEDGGLLVEITDCGTGLPPGELHEINERLAAPPVVDISVSRQMGLFVVSRLAARHRIRVRLRQQRGEFGITASVLVPSSLVEVDPQGPADPLAQPAAPAAVMGPAAAGAEARRGPGWGEPGEEPPIQVSVVEAPAEGDLFSPSSISHFTPASPGPQRTAEEEWHELFGRREEPVRQDMTPQADPAPQAAGAQSAADVLMTPGGSAAGAGAGAARAADEVHEHIFEAVSAWFRERQSASSGGSGREGRDAGDGADLAQPAASGTELSRSRGSSSSSTAGLEWRSAGDEGWQAASALRASVDFEVTAAGLPRRRPRAQLVPGAAGPSALGPSPTGNGPVRKPDDVRGRLTSYQRGLYYGRHARRSPDDQHPNGYPGAEAPDEAQQ